MMLYDILSILNVIIFLVLLWMVKGVLDNHFLLHQYPFLKNTSFRLGLICIVIAPLAKATEPEYLMWCHLAGDLALAVCAATVGIWLLKQQKAN